MKKTLLLLALTPLFSIGQVQTTVAAGDFYNPMIWDCTCLPADGDSLVINHAVNMNIDIYYTSGRITINAGGSLTEGAQDRAVWVDGTGSIYNLGTFTTHLFMASPSVEIQNSGNFANVDSVLNQGNFINSGTMSVYDLLNDQAATFTNSGDISVSNDMNNQGYFYVSGSGTIDLSNDFSNCNIQSMDAMFENDGTFCIANDFSNCSGDTLNGTGHYYIGGSSANLGVFTGTFTFHTPSGTIGIPGTIDGGVTVTTGACDLSLVEPGTEGLVAHPNPAHDRIKVNNNGSIYRMYSPEGKIVQSGSITAGEISLTDLLPGVYILEVEGFGTVRILKQN